MIRGQGFNRISPAKKDPKQKLTLSVASVASRLRNGPKPVPPMGKSR